MHRCLFFEEVRVKEDGESGASRWRIHNQGRIILSNRWRNCRFKHRGETGVACGTRLPGQLEGVGPLPWEGTGLCQEENTSLRRGRHSCWWLELWEAGQWEWTFTSGDCYFRHEGHLLKVIGNWRRASLDSGKVGNHWLVLAEKEVKRMGHFLCGATLPWTGEQPITLIPCGEIRVNLFSWLDYEYLEGRDLVFFLSAISILWVVYGRNQ